MKHRFRIHDTARVKAGRLAGLVGTVTGTRDDQEGRQIAVRVQVEGVRDDKPVKGEQWLKAHQVEVHQ